MSKPLRSFAKKQADEEQKSQASLVTTATETTEQTPAETADETPVEPTEEQPPEQLTQTEEKAPPAEETAAEASLEMASISASELQTLRADAASWQAHQAEYGVLKAWYQNAQQVGTASAKEDETTRAGRQVNSTAEQPWNKKAAELMPKK